MERDKHAAIMIMRLISLWERMKPKHKKILSPKVRTQKCT